MEFSSLIIGGGITGLQTALDLADQGYKVLIVEKEPSIGGTMIALSKVFPTLDCSSCITTPKMSAAHKHENITTYTYCEIISIERGIGQFRVKALHKPRHVDVSKCIGCSKCEYECPIDVPHEFEGNLGARKAIYIPFSTAIPQKALLDPESCIQCGRCAKICPTDAIDYTQEPVEEVISTKSIVLATGFRPTENTKREYGAGTFTNVLDGLTVERLLSPHGPYGRVLRPSDGKMPDNVAYIQCAGSRDKSLGVPYCSRVCCMFAIKQAMLLSGALPLADITIYYMDIRAFGKGYEQFYKNSEAMGIVFTKAKVASIKELENGDLSLRIEIIGEEGGVKEIIHDIVVLSSGMLPGWIPKSVEGVQTDDDGFIKSISPKIDPNLTTSEGVFVAGAAAGPKDIVDSIVEASGAAMKVSVFLHEQSQKKGSEMQRGETETAESV